MAGFSMAGQAKAEPVEKADPLAEAAELDRLYGEAAADALEAGNAAVY